MTVRSLRRHEYHRDTTCAASASTARFLEFLRVQNAHIVHSRHPARSDLDRNDPLTAADRQPPTQTSAVSTLLLYSHCTASVHIDAACPIENLNGMICCSSGFSVSATPGQESSAVVLLVLLTLFYASYKSCTLSPELLDITPRQACLQVSL